MQRNHCVNLLRKTKKNYFTNSNKAKADGKTFWKTTKPNFNEKGSSLVKLYFQKKVYFEQQKNLNEQLLYK